jgi:hypothetical protein
MARYRKVDTRIWNDEKFCALSDDAKLLFFFLLTHPHLTALGAMRISVAGMAGELNWSSERLSIALREVFQKSIVKYDEKALFLWLPNFLKYNPPESPNVVKSWSLSLDYLPECTLKKALINQVISRVERLSIGFREALGEAFRKGMPYQEQEHKQEQKQKQKQEQKQESLNIKVVENITVSGAERKNALGAVVEIPLNSGENFLIFQNQVEEWQTLYPAVNILQELRNIRGWNISNPKRRKTKAGILNHITAWLSKVQNASHQTIHSRSPPKQFSSHNLQEFNQQVCENWLKESESKTYEGEIVK